MVRCDPERFRGCFVSPRIFYEILESKFKPFFSGSNLRESVNWSWPGSESPAISFLCPSLIQISGSFFSEFPIHAVISISSCGRAVAAQ